MWFQPEIRTHSIWFVMHYNYRSWLNCQKILCCTTTTLKCDKHLHVSTFLVPAGPGPALVDAVMAQLYCVAGINIPTVAFRVPLMTSSVMKTKLTGWPPPVWVQTMLYPVMIPFCCSGGGGSQKKTTISGTSSITENIKFCGGASGARREEYYGYEARYPCVFGKKIVAYELPG